MRTLRLSLAGTAILMLLAGLSGVVVAQDEEALATDGPHRFSGPCTYAGSYGSESSGSEDGRWWRHGYLGRCRSEMDDPRLSGDLWTLWNHESVGGGIHCGTGEVLTGTVELVNDGGSWVGTMRGYIVNGPRTHFWQLDLNGTGAYEGLSALAYAIGPGGGAHEFEGFVFPGALPTYPEPVVPGQ